jgi:hypothetical protein
LKIPFQPSEDSDALLSELPPLSQNVHAADPSQIRKDGSRRVPDQGYRRGVEGIQIKELLIICFSIILLFHSALAIYVIP